MVFKKIVLWSACLLGLVFRAQAYVTSATLEYMGDDKCGFYLNGRELLSFKESDSDYYCWSALSTSDGTLPLDLFNNNGDNLLAAVNYDVMGGDMYMAYRLTVHHSNGDPVVVWGEPSKTKFLNLPRNHPFPQGWNAPGFSDAAWGTAVQMTAGYAQGKVHMCPMEDGHFAGFLGQKGFVPFLSHNTNAATNPRDCDLYRSHFSFPNTLGKATLIMNPKSAYNGQQVAFRLLPSRDAADFGTFRTFVRLPKGLQPGQIFNNGKFDAANRTITWTLANPSSAAAYVKLVAQSLAGPNSWQLPEKALRPYNPALKTDGRFLPDNLVTDAAGFFPDQPAWFKFNSPVAPAAGAQPSILGVIFRSQYRLGGRDSGERKGANQIYVNYSVDGSNQGFLKQDALFSHAANDGSSGVFSGPHYADAYYDATEDRKWTWADLAGLRVKLQSRMAASKQQDFVASLRCTVRIFTPNNVSPSFLAKVDEVACKEVEIMAGMADAKSGLKAADSYKLALNQNACPTATFTPIPTPAPTPMPGVTPAPTTTPVKPPVDFGLACLQNSPEPFKRGGTFIIFCLTKEANVSIKIMNPAGGLIRTLNLGSYRPGNSQVFFNALDASGNLLPAGTYIYEVRAETEEGVQSRHSQFNKVNDVQAGRAGE